MNEDDAKTASLLTAPSNRDAHVWLGKGTFGEVYEIDGKAYKVCALIKKNEHEHLMVDNVIREATFYSYINHARSPTQRSHNNTTVVFEDPPEAIPTAKVHIESRKVIFVMDNLGVPLHKVKYQSKTQMCKLFSQLLQACSWLHSRKWSHGDIKPSNILVRNDKLYLIDYGSILFSSRFKLNAQRCTLYYVAPEELLHYTVGPKGDIWSIGTVMFEFITGLPFILALLNHLKVAPATVEMFVKYVNKDDNNNQFNSREFLVSVYSTLMYGNILNLLQSYVKDREICGVLAHCLIIDPSARASANHLLTFEEFFRQYRSFTSNSPAVLKDITYDDIDIFRFNPLSYEVVSHAGSDLSDRTQVIKTIVRSIKQTPYFIDDEIFLHIIMLYDRSSFRFLKYYNVTSTNTLEHAVVKSLQLLFCVHLSSMMFKSTTTSIEQLVQCLDKRSNVSIDKVITMLLKFLRIMDFRLLNYTPDMYKELLRNGATTFKDTEVDQVIKLALFVPWIHSSIYMITHQMYPELFDNLKQDW